MEDLTATPSDMKDERDSIAEGDPDTGNSGTAASVVTAGSPKPITDSMISLEPDFFEYDGKEHSPELTVKDGEIVLKENTDYMVTAQDSTKATGDYKVTVEGIGAYTGSASASWCIKDTTSPTVLGVADGDKCESPLSFSVTDTDQINLWNITLQNDKETWDIKLYFDFLDKSGVWIGYFSIDLDPGIYTIIAPVHGSHNPGTVYGPL